MLAGKPRFLSAEQKAQQIALSLGIPDEDFRHFIQLKPTLVKNFLQIGHITQQTHKIIQGLRGVSL